MVEYSNRPASPTVTKGAWRGCVATGRHPIGKPQAPIFSGAMTGVALP